MEAIVVKNLVKKFGNFAAVDDVSFSVKKGEIFGFLGPNGAGKTTTIKMLCGLLKPTAGSGLVAGLDIKKDHKEIKSRIGYMSQRFSLYRDLTVEENIDFFGGVYGLTQEQIVPRKQWILKMAGLAGKEKILTADLSGGFKQRLALGCGLIHNPQILFLDEPTSGVDPISRRNFWELIYELSHNQGVTTIVTTHYLDEAEYCHNLILIYQGKIIASDTPQDLRKKYDNLGLEEIFIKLIREKEK